jgi:5'-deoxynucleotidase YfbR-like HD superfamily hydrolase
MQISDQLSFIYAAGETRRFHTQPVLRTQNIADHSWHVAMLLHIMYGQDEPGITPVLLMAALCHDAAECRFGDIPSPAKRGMGELMPDFREKWGEMEEAMLEKYALDWNKFLTDDERRQLKLADSMEGAMYCVRELEMGNRMMLTPFLNFVKYIDEIILPGEDVPLEPRKPTVADREWEARQYIHERWSKANER